MSVTVYDVETRARDILDDVYGNDYRWSTPKLVRYIYDGIRLLHSIRPESRYVGLVLTPLVVPTISEDATVEQIVTYREAALTIDDRWAESIVHYVVQKAFALDASDTVNAERSKYHQGEFERLAKS